MLAELVASGRAQGDSLPVGTCGALSDSLELGELVIAQVATRADGTSRALGAGERAPTRTRG